MAEKESNTTHQTKSTAKEKAAKMLDHIGDLIAGKDGLVGVSQQVNSIAIEQGDIQMQNLALATESILNPWGAMLEELDDFIGQAKKNGEQDSIQNNVAVEKARSLQSLVDSVACLSSQAKEVLGSIQSTFGSHEEDAQFQCALAMVEKIGLIADATNGYQHSGSAEDWFEPYNMEVTS